MADGKGKRVLNRYKVTLVREYKVDRLVDARNEDEARSIMLDLFLKREAMPSLEPKVYVKEIELVSGSEDAPVDEEPVNPEAEKEAQAEARESGDRELTAAEEEVVAAYNRLNNFDRSALAPCYERVGAIAMDADQWCADATDLLEEHISRSVSGNGQQGLFDDNYETVVKMFESLTAVEYEGIADQFDKMRSLLKMYAESNVYSSNKQMSSPEMAMRMHDEPKEREKFLGRAESWSKAANDMEVGGQHIMRFARAIKNALKRVESAIEDDPVLDINAVDDFVALVERQVKDADEIGRLVENTGKEYASVVREYSEKVAALANDKA